VTAEPRTAARRAVVTGIGLITSLGEDVETLWSSLLSGASGVSAIERFDASDFPTRIAAEIKDFDPHRHIPKKDARLMSRFTQFALVATMRALEDASLQVPRDVDEERIGVMIGSGAGGTEPTEEQALILHRDGVRGMHPYYSPMMLTNIPAAHVTMLVGAHGPSAGVATACAAGANAIGEGLRLIQHDDVDVVICGGTESPLHPVGLGGFCAMRALSTRNDDPAGASRPFDRGRDGFVMAEGAGIVVLEELEHARARGATIYAEVAGFGMSSDGYHLTAPRPDGMWQARCMQRAIADAGMDPSDVDYVNAHATATKVGDLGEVRAIRAAFGDHAHRLACSSTKSMTGHLLGAAGTVEAVICMLSVQRDAVPPTINLDEPDPQCDLDLVPCTARTMTVRAAVSNSFGFGGHNASLVFRKAPPA
jgi:3-oxoacyl-[acyl-carrier-protein] synthase II